VTELTEGGGDNGAAMRQRQSIWPARTRGRGKRGGGDRVLERALAREDERGKKRGRDDDGAPFIGDAARGGGRVTGGEAWGGGEPAHVVWPTVVQPRRSRAVRDQCQNRG
jgi:hypothetical protein